MPYFTFPTTLSGRLVLPLLLSFTLLTINGCLKKDANPALPPETMTGAMTFGCKVDGRVFHPRNGKGRDGLYVQYVNLGASKGGGYYLNIPARDWKQEPSEGVQLTTDSLLVEEGKTYPFMTGKGQAYARYSRGNYFEKLNQDAGELTITRFDRTQGILSGRFHFIGTNQTTGQQVRVTDGRFDVRF